MIGPRVAGLLYALLIVASLATLHGKALAVALVIVLGLAAKSCLDYLRRRVR
ncbi:MAG TPA: hypothetical protein VGL97_00615 [Bryobacteraceae bacterium]